MKKRKMLCGELVIGFFCMAAAAALLIVNEYQHYREKLETAAAVMDGKLAKERVIKQLKGEIDFTEKEIDGQLVRYGYEGVLQNSFGRRFLKISGWIIFGGGMLYAGYAAVLLCNARRYEKNQKQREHEIAEKLESIRDGNATQEFFELEDAQGIAEQLEGLSEYLELMKEQAFREKEETKSLVTDISHQLKTPVAALNSCFEVLKNEKLGEQERAEFEYRMEQQLKGLEQLVASLINISRMETGMITVKPEKRRIFDTILEAINRVWVKADEKQIEMIMEEDKDTNQLELTHDRKWLCEAIVNVLDNAVKYSPKHSAVRIACRKRSSFIRIEVADAGIGIKPQEYHKVFQRFYRGNLEAVQKEEGAGVGLYLARKIIEDHHGMIFIERKPADKQRGTTFVIQLPCQ